MKGHKKRKREEKFDRKVVEEESVETSGPEADGVEDKSTTEVTQNENLSEKEKRAEELATEVPSIPISLAKDAIKANKPGVVFILEKASLEVLEVGKNYQLLNSEKHANFLRRKGWNP